MVVRTLLFVCLGLWFLVPSLGCKRSPAIATNQPPTFSQTIAPIVFDNCATCHRPNGAAPFSLLKYRDVEKRAEQILDVIQSRYMPPWLPEQTSHRFAGERRLSKDQIELFATWINAGKPEGDKRQLPPTPSWTDGWTLGEPDLVLQMPESYTRPASSQDTWRNFVLPSQVTSRKFVRALEFDPGNRKAVHHAVVMTDTTGGSRTLDLKDPQPGFAGMQNGKLGLGDFAHPPNGHLIGWTPGKVPQFGDPDIAWELMPQTDLVVQLHLPATGKSESVRSRLGFYFSDQPPTKKPYSLLFSSRDIDIAAGDSNHVVTMSYELPVDVTLLSVYPHAHYLAVEVELVAINPQGVSDKLLQIDDWNFDWQDEYRFETPVPLHAGTQFQIRFRFDNSAQNIRNRNSPPQRVTYGEQSDDEMAEMSLQVLTTQPSDRNSLIKDFDQYQFEQSLQRNLARLRSDPQNPRNSNAVGETYLLLGQYPEAIKYLNQYVRVVSNDSKAYQKLAVAYSMLKQPSQAVANWQLALDLQPNDIFARRELLKLYQSERNLNGTIEQLKAIVRLEPTDYISMTQLGTFLGLSGDNAESIRFLQAAVSMNSSYAVAHANLANSLRIAGKNELAIEHLRKAIQLDPHNDATRQMLDNLMP